jgi:hypothetical protein
MFLVKVQGDEITYPYSVSQLKSDNPNTSFSSPLNPESLADFGAYEVVRLPAPSFDPNTQKLVVQDTPTLNEGVWEISTTAESLTDAELAAETESLAIRARTRRDEELAETDRYGLSDLVMTEDMATYRQALRDVPQQEGFPRTITWPILDTQVYDAP